MSTVDGVEITGPLGEARGDASAAGRWDDARALFTETAVFIEMALATSDPAP